MGYFADHICRDLFLGCCKGIKKRIIADHVDRSGDSLRIAPDTFDGLLGENFSTIVTGYLETVANIIPYLAVSQRVEMAANSDPLL